MISRSGRLFGRYCAPVELEPERDRTEEPIAALRLTLPVPAAPLAPAEDRPGIEALEYLEPVSRFTAGVAPVNQAGAPLGALICACASEAV